MLTKFESDQRKTSRAASSGEVADSSDEDLHLKINNSTSHSAHGAGSRIHKKTSKRCMSYDKNLKDLRRVSPQSLYFKQKTSLSRSPTSTKAI